MEVGKSGSLHARPNKDGPPDCRCAVRQNVTQDTVLVAWHISTMKLTVLREWLEAEGEHGVLPLDDICLTVIHHFRPDLEAAMFDSSDAIERLIK
ncbi:hypothetical protein EV127DRAFT_436959 [Xylaria flabelliformis]|nr:hypothetical protein EV127DRAFT_436959 [Xylaria flabelliformis]